METTANILHIGYDFETRLNTVTFTIDTKQITPIEELKGVKLILSVKKYRKKRSLDSNAYLWVLIGKLADKLNISPKEIYKNAIADLNTYYVLPLPNEEVDNFINDWEKRDKSNSGGWFCEKFDSKLDGYTNVRAYFGSSVYTSKEMNALLDRIIDECKQQDIETMTPQEIERLKGAWYEEQKSKGVRYNTKS